MARKEVPPSISTTIIHLRIRNEHHSCTSLSVVNRPRAVNGVASSRACLTPTSTSKSPPRNQAAAARNQIPTHTFLLSCSTSITQRPMGLRPCWRGKRSLCGLRGKGQLREHLRGFHVVFLFGHELRDVHREILGNFKLSMI